MKRTYTQKTEDYSHYPTVLPVSQGGTGESNLTDIALKYKLIPLDAIGIKVAKKPTGQLSIEDFSSAPSGFDVTLSGPKETSAGVTETYTITNYDFSMNYGEITNIDPTDLTIQANPSVNGEVVTYKAPGKEGNYGFKLNGRSYPVLVSGAKAVQPIILQPAMNGVVGQKVVDFIGTPFSVAGGADTLELASWELSTETVAAGGSPTFPQASTIQSTSTTTTFTCNTLQVSKTYYLRVKYKGKTSKESDWSTVVAFTTAASFSKLSVKKKITNTTLNSSSNFGQCVRLFDAGRKIAIGAPGYNAKNVVASGAVFIYDTVTSAIIDTVTEFPAPVANHRFGESLDITEDGLVMVVGIPGWSGTRLPSTPISGSYQLFEANSIPSITKYHHVAYGDLAAYNSINPTVGAVGGATTGGGFRCNIEKREVGVRNLTESRIYVEFNWPGDTSVSHGGVDVFMLLKNYSTPQQQTTLTAENLIPYRPSSYASLTKDDLTGVVNTGFGRNAISVYDQVGVIVRFTGGLKSDAKSGVIEYHYDSTPLTYVPGCGFVCYNIIQDGHHARIQNFVAPAGDCAAGDDYSWDMAFAAAPHILAVSAPGVGGSKGKVYIYTQFVYKTKFTLTAILESDTPTANERFGESISLSDSGVDLTVGSAKFTSGTDTNCGKVYKFSRTGNVAVNGGWELIGSFLNPTPKPGDMLGYSVSESLGGVISAVSAPNEDSPQNIPDVGAVYLLV